MLRISLLLLLLPLTTLCQELSYTHYDIKDGLAGSTVYCMTRDKEGFLWFGTETGLSRFDGTHFTNFTVRDGLPDNEILQLFTDSKGRVWMSPFRNAVCYYYKGKVYNQENDPHLAKLPLAGNVFFFAEDGEGNILMKELDRLHVLKTNGNVQTIFKMHDRPLEGATIAAVSNAGHFRVMAKDTLYQIFNDRFQAYAVLPHKTPTQHLLSSCIYKDWVAYRHEGIVTLENVKTNLKYQLEVPSTFLRVAFINDSLFFMSSYAGVQVFNMNDFSHPNTYLRGRPVSGMMVDQENSLWFSTLGHGIYRLNSAFVRNLVALGKEDTRLGVYSIFKVGDQITAGAELNYLLQVAIEKNELKLNRKTNLLDEEKRIKIFSGTVLNNGEVILATDQAISKTTHDFRLLKEEPMPLKVMKVLNNRELLVGTNHNLVVWDPYNFRTKENIWSERTLSVHHCNDTFYIGTLGGLYLKPRKGKAIEMGVTIPALRDRVSMISESADCTLWIGTFNGGIVAYKGGRIVTHLTVDQGLSSNTVRCLYLKGNTLWAGTDKGLNKIDIGKPGYPVIKYSIADGLASDMINAIFVEGQDVFLGTSEGLTWFQEGKISSQSTCDLRITGITVADSSLPAGTKHFSIAPGNKSFQVSFVGISYKSGGDIQYRYRLSGLDTTWRTTRETFLSYPTLPWGEYQLEIQAGNKYGVVSNTVKLPFVVEKRWWEKSWFVLTAVAVSVFLVWLWTNFRISRIQEREREKLVVNKRINELEQLALRAQMNPHFIFNTLNSIQHYVMDKDIAGANKFIATFSRLIRQTMYFSSKSYITLSEEIAYLGTYLELEKDRLEGKFNYSIQVEPGLKVSEYSIPPMILQPYVENSVRHGIRYRNDNEGLISIHINKDYDRLMLVVEDNGVGRQTAGLFNSKHPIEYQSKGMSLTADRIAMLNRDNPEKITVQIDDLKDATGKATGTRITVVFPVLVN